MPYCGASILIFTEFQQVRGRKLWKNSLYKSEEYARIAKKIVSIALARGPCNTSFRACSTRGASRKQGTPLSQFWGDFREYLPCGPDTWSPLAWGGLRATTGGEYSRCSPQRCQMGCGKAFIGVRTGDGLIEASAGLSQQIKCRRRSSGSTDKLRLLDCLAILPVMPLCRRNLTAD